MLKTNMELQVIQYNLANSLCEIEHETKLSCVCALKGQLKATEQAGFRGW